eukprot:8617357-Pyramimonas_sp.AAC.1
MVPKLPDVRGQCAPPFGGPERPQRESPRRPRFPSCPLRRPFGRTGAKRRVRFENMEEEDGGAQTPPYKNLNHQSM